MLVLVFFGLFLGVVGVCFVFWDGRVKLKFYTSKKKFCSFDLFCPLLKKDSSIETFYIVLSCLIK